MSDAHSWWRLSKDDVRARVADVNDGVLGVAGLAEGLALVLDTTRLPLVVLMASAAGAVSLGAAKYAETAAEREAQQDVIRAEQYLLELSHAEELDELAQHYRDKGVSEETARKVAEELDAADALSAQLETEYGIREILTPGEPLKEAVSAAVAFMLGALVTVLIAISVPPAWVEEFILVGVALSLTVTAVVLSKLSGTRVWPAIIRSLIIGVAALGASVLIGSLIS
ncbi:VIT1/CCC1 transporter family protein [Micropruina sp.]|uniref:VIT1/CCC1 transporter family protein n=1 Tax=Micropruina sp. TaxID=2737536 RepID=UPI0026073043|nr:VIT1/CCC1 transporter family protein [Micropruina sp.]